MKLKNNTVITKLLGNTIYFKLLWTILVLLKINPFVSSKTSPLFQGLIVYGGIILVYDFFTNKKMFSSRYFLLSLFVLFMGVSIIVNFNKDFLSNLKILIITVIQLFVITRVDLERSSENNHEELKAINSIIVVGVTIGAIISLYLFLKGINGSYIIASNDVSLDDSIYYYGIAYQNRLVGIFSNPNVTGATCGIALYCALINITLSRNSFILKMLYVISMLLNFLCIILSASRGAFLSLCVSLFFFIFIVLLIKNKRNNIIAKSVVGLLIVAISVVLVYNSAGVINKQITKFPLYLQNSDMEINEQAEYSKDSISNYIDIDSDLNEVSSGRLRIWRVGFRTIKQNLIFGVGKAELYNEMVKNWDKNSTPFGIKKGGLHNIFLETLVAFGLLSFICFVIFLVNLLWNHFMKILKITFSLDHSTQPLFGLVILTMLIYIIANNLVESKMLYQVRLSSYIFALYIGYSMYFLQTNVVDHKESTFSNSENYN
jgi:O-antigen ligase